MEITNLGPDQKAVVCAAINGAGRGGDSLADNDTLRLFKVEYMRECLQRALDQNVFTPVSAAIAKYLLEVL